MNATPRFEVALIGGGAIGSRFEAAFCEPAAGITFIDNQRLQPENLGGGAFGETDLFQDKARVLAARRRARPGVGRALCGDVRYALRPGLVRALDAAVLALDNPTAVRDATAALWAGGSSPLPVLALTCGGAEGGYQARLFVRPGLCPVCLFGEADRRADCLGSGSSCVDTSAPRASAAAAEAAARAGAAILARWRAGDYGLANCRVQCDANQGEAYVIRMPQTLSPRCPVTHCGVGDWRDSIEELGGAIAAVMVGTLAERAITCVGDDAEIVLDRRAVPLGGLYCPRCRAISTARPLLVPAALATWQACACGWTPRPLGECSTLSARELLGSEVAALSLAAWGAGHGDEFVATGRNGRVRLRCTFEWSDLE